MDKTPDSNKEPQVIKAAPLIPSLNPPNPEQRLLNKGKKTIKLNMQCYVRKK